MTQRVGIVRRSTSGLTYEAADAAGSCAPRHVRPACFSQPSGFSPSVCQAGGFLGTVTVDSLQASASGATRSNGTVLPDPDAHLGRGFAAEEKA